MITIIDSKNTYISENAKLGDNCVIYPNVVIEGNTVIGDNTTIYMSSYIKDSVIGKNNVIYTSYIIDSKIGDNNQIGPYANIRSGNRLGSFVELKENSIGNGNKIPHLSFIGNAIVKENVHIGCGSITVNKKFDSKIGERETTIIEDNSFIGCNVNLLAPLKIGMGSVIAAGSTITDNVPDNALAVARTRQTIKENYH